MHALTSRFLSAFAKIEQRLSALVDSQNSKTFYQLVAAAGKSVPAVRFHEADLREFANLRNVLVHRYDSQHELAVPNEQTVTQLEALVDLIAAPPRLDSLFARPVAMCSPEDSIQAAAREMVKGDFSQLPVVDDRQVVDVLTAETITRWLAVQFSKDGLLEHATVDSVLTHKEDKSTYKMLARNATAFDAIKLFDDALHSGHTYDAILLTHNGKQTEKLIGILTPSDIPRLLSAIHV